MRTLSNCEAALLVLLSEGPAHPYQIEKMVEERSMGYWTDLSQSSIYKTLRKLEEKGFAESEVSLNEKNVGRKTYAITAAGRLLLAEVMKAYLSEPEKEKWRIDLATSHLDLVAPDEAERYLAAYEAEVEKLIAGYRDLEEYMQGSGCAQTALALARRPRMRYEAELRWVRSYRDELRLSMEGKEGER